MNGLMNPQIRGQRPTRKRGGFSLIELVIVVVIIGIIGAIAIPRMSRGAAGAADGALKANLAVLRNALELYHAEHGNTYPSLGDLEDALTQYSDANGQNFSSAKDTTHIYGPYLRSIPPLPVGPNKGKTTFTATAVSGVPTSSSDGWHYDASTGVIKANSGTLTDESGKLYTDY